MLTEESEKWSRSTC